MYDQFIKQAKKSHFYKKLTRRTYRRSHGYIDYKEIAAQLSFNLVGAEQISWDVIKGDTAWEAVCFSGWLACNSEFPVWALTKPLTQAFLQTDLPAHIFDLKRIVPWGILMLPEIIKNPDGHFLQWLFFHHMLAEEELPAMRFRHKLIHPLPIDADKIRWASVMRGGTAYSSIIELAQDEINKLTKGDLHIADSVHIFGENTETQTEEEFIKTVDNLLLQTLLYLQTRPLELQQSGLVGFGGKKGKQSAKNLAEPIWIGKNYQLPQMKKNSSTHASPRMHWRRGHYRRVAFGEGRRERKWTWIEPTLVNAEGGNS